MNSIILWVLLISLLLISTLLACFVSYNDKEATKAEIKEWLKWAVVEAEKMLGSGTGQLKLHHVYDMAVMRFPYIVHLITFDVFKIWVDEALEWMKDQVADNKAVQSYIES